MKQPPCITYLVTIPSAAGDAEILITAWPSSPAEAEFRIMPDYNHWRPVHEIGGTLVVREYPKAA